MKIPRDLSGQDLIKVLAKLGYEPTRQTGSHIRLTTEYEGKHSVTIPAHNPIKIGTLNSILKEIGQHFNISRDDVLQRLFS
jgi:predicted RNA binding protein YcfA (HicA-like mRNA interferase family)